MRVSGTLKMEKKGKRPRDGRNVVLDCHGLDLSHTLYMTAGEMVPDRRSSWSISTWYRAWAVSSDSYP
ncbi:hypothetical protein IG631_22505 [Alternaria alternata]|nr:hypothetical protein IG631_22505 [Alternaria alternata]